MITVRGLKSKRWKDEGHLVMRCSRAGFVGLCYDGLSEKSKLSNVELG